MAVTVKYDTYIDNYGVSSQTYEPQSFQQILREGAGDIITPTNTGYCKVPLIHWSTFNDHYSLWKNYLGHPKIGYWYWCFYLYNWDSTSSSICAKTNASSSPSSGVISVGPYANYTFQGQINLSAFASNTINDQWIEFGPNYTYFNLQSGIRSYYGIHMEYELPNFDSAGTAITNTNFLKYAAWYGYNWSTTPTTSGTINAMTMTAKPSQGIYRTQGYTTTTISFNSGSSVSASDVTSKLQKDLIYTYHFN